VKALLGGILMAIGILIAGASGLCSAWFFLFVIGGASNNSASGFASLTVMVLLVGGLPFVGGIGMILAGRSVLRRSRPERYDHDVF
jgi:hypothetical protein